MYWRQCALKGIISQYIVYITANKYINMSASIGRNAALLTQATLFTIISAIIGVWSTYPRTSLKSYYVKIPTSFLILILGYFALIYLAVLYKNGNSNTLENANTPPNERHALKFQLGLAWIFGLCLVFHESILTAIDIDCWNRGTFLIYQSSTLYGILQMVFTFCQLITVSLFFQKRLPSSSRSSFAIYFLILTNVWNWMRSTIQDVIEMDIHGFTWFNITAEPSKSEHYQEGLDCFWFSDLQLILLKLAPYLIPAHLEYFLLMTMLIIRMQSSSHSVADLEYEDQTMYGHHLTDTYLYNPDENTVATNQEKQNIID